MGRTLSSLLVALALLSGCMAVGRPPAADGPKTLLNWSGGSSPTADLLAEDGESDAAGCEEPDPITTERPDFTNSSRTVGRGRVQLESGYTYVADGSGSNRVVGHSYPEALLRLGVLANWFEVQVGQNFRSARPTGLTPTNGAEDLYLAVKFALTPQDGVRPETALTLQATVPTGSRDNTGNRTLPGLLYLYSWDLVPDLVSLAGSTVATAAVDPDDHTYLLAAQSLSVGYTLTDRLGSYTEFFGLLPAGATAAGVGPEYYFNGGFLYRVTPDFQLDVRAGVGLNRGADDFFTGAGFAVRY